MSRRAGGRELTNEEKMIAYGELEREMNELRNNIARETNPSEKEVLSAWRELVEFSRAEAYGNFEPRTAKLADTAERVGKKRYGSARIIEVAPIRKPTANTTANATVNATVNATENATDAPEGRPTGVAYKERDEPIEATDQGRVKSESMKKETTSEKRNIKPEKREKVEVGGNDTETHSKDKKKIKTKLRQPSTSTESSEEEEDAPTRQTSPRKDKGEKKKSKHKSSENEGDEKSHRKSIKDKSCKDKVKTKKRCKLEFLTDESSEAECPKKPRKRRPEMEEESTSHTSSNEDSTSDASTKRSTKKEKQKNGKHFKKWLVLEKFDGTTPLSIFLNQLDTCARYNGWDLEDKASYLRVSLKGNAAYIIDDENLEGASCRRLIKSLKSRFGTEGQSSLYRSLYRTVVSI